MGRGQKGREFHGGTRWVSRVPSLTTSAPPHFDVYFCFFSCLSVFSVETRSTEDKLKASLEFSRRRTNFHTSSHIISVERSKRNLLEWPLPANTDSMIQQISTISVIIPTAFLS
ncbi:hypothetical protein CGCF415_v000022 [Colletotrichum fructicola]|nr:hypothetical protein CGCFRS4_v000448 [Colletotrichum fructicola]KAF4917033.1 hypothetical protein CGCF415_v000022 [Colletotrichum fructicola]KAF4935145.1 hypothetical protein CGCF245_v007871 [Colletotrichum fructicola]